MNSPDYIGQILDQKYRIETELGRGGMGAVYLATHVGTERPVAVKIIASQFMRRPEFVERFRREARAAGRLRHPNVVNVTDFGFAEAAEGSVAYLVMEYLDGCTLGEILDEEKNLPLDWTLDILEQVCSAVHEAHQQGIIHRDLKPDNIWLEPNQRGGYTVKVLDFGIAKLEEIEDRLAGGNGFPESAPINAARHTMADADGETHADVASDTLFSEASTVALVPGTAVSEAGTLILPAPSADDKTALLDKQKTAFHEPNAKSTQVDGSNPYSLDHSGSSGSDLTRVGSVLGTPLYMSPEQCRGEKLDPRSDIYSLGVIAYQMISGKTPFVGDFKEVMEAHRESPPPPLSETKVRKKVKNVVLSALSKDPASRPSTAEAFASEMRAQSEGIGELLRRSLVIYSAHLPKFLGLAVMLYVPFTLVTLLNIGINAFYLSYFPGVRVPLPIRLGLVALSTCTGIFCGYLILGTTTWLVNQILAVPLRPVRIKPAMEAIRKSWKKLLGTGLLSTAITVAGYALCFFPGLVLSVLFALIGPVVMMENLKGFAAMKRSNQLVRRSLRTTVAAVFIMFMVPFITAVATSYIAEVSIRAFSAETAAPAKSESQDPSSANAGDQPGTAAGAEDVLVKVDPNSGVQITSDNKNMGKRIKEVIREALSAILMLPFQILIASLSSIIGALLYLKTRQVGGESMNDLFAQFEDSEQPRKKWQERARQRLIQSGRITSRS